MKGEDRKFDEKYHILKPNSRKSISLDQFKSLYIASGLTLRQIANTSFLPLEEVKFLIEKHDLVALRQRYIEKAVVDIQHQQAHQANKLLDLEQKFKSIKLIQLEKQLEDYMAYYARHGDFYKRHPTTGDILVDLDQIPIQIRIPNAVKEISALKESVILSQGIRQLLQQLKQLPSEDLKPTVPSSNEAIDIADYAKLVFKPSDNDDA